MFRLLTIALGMAFDGQTDELVKKELARFEGVWSFSSVVVDGEKRPELPFSSNKIIIGKDGRFIILQGTRITRGVFKIDPTSSPKHFDVIPSLGPKPGRTIKSIYELSDDSYRVCGSFKDNERPGKFESQPKSGLILQVLKREKQSIEDATLHVGRVELAGTWQAVTYSLNGKSASAEDLKTVQLVFDAEGNAKALNNGKVFLASSTKLDLSKEPMAIDITFTEGDSKGKTAKGIYKIDGKILTICRSDPEQPRPAEFSSGEGLTLMTYERIQAAAK